jgi:hypothetical protein
MMHRNVLSGTHTHPTSPNTRFSPMPRTPAPSSPLNPASMETITDIIEITTINPPQPPYRTNALGTHTHYSSVRQSAIPLHIL